MQDKIDSCAIVLDSTTRVLAKSISYIELANFAHVLSDVDEINEAYNGMPIIIFESLLMTKVSIATLRDLRYRFNIDFILIYSNDEIGSIATSVCKLKKCDYRVIDVNLIYSVIMNDDVVFEAYKNVEHSIFSFRDIADDLNEKDTQYFKLMYHSLLDCYIQYNSLLKQYIDLQGLCDGYEAIFNKVKKGVTQLQEYYDSVNVRVSEYETRLSADFDKIVDGEYPNRPIILYFKEFQHIQGMDILLGVLHFVITVQYRRSCKVVKLLDSSNALQTRFIPSNYTFMQNSYNNRDILESNFIAKRGLYDLFFDLLLLNRSKLHILIVHDMRGCTSLALNDRLISSSVCCATSEYKQVFTDVNLLTESKKASKLFWNSSEYSKIPVSERLFKLSAHPTVRALIDEIL